MPGSSVYVVQQRYSRQPDGSQRFHNYDTAFKFGVVTYLVPAKAIVDDLYGGDVDALFRDRLQNFTANDYLILTGDPVLCAQAVLTAVGILGDEVTTLKILKWNHEDNDYIPVEITIPF